MSSVRRLLIVFILLFQIPVAIGAGKTGSEGPSFEQECNQILEATFLSETDSDLAKSIEEELAVRSDRRSLMDLLAKDDAKNLAVQAPFMLMNAAQRVGVLARTHGTDTVRLSGLSQDITVYNLVSNGIKGQRLVGQEASIEALFENIDSQAIGDRAAASIPLLIGSHGSGKSALIQVLNEAFKDATLTLNSPYAVWSFEWSGLDKIPEAVYLNPRLEENDGTLDAALDDSPILLLPADVRDALIERATPAVLKITDGRQTPMPFLTLNPQDQEIRHAVLSHYRKKLGHDLNSSEILTALNRHVKLKRVVWDSSSGALPVIDASGNDVDTAALFLTPNPVMRVTRGAADIFAWEPGKMLKGHGNVIFLDEELRNPESLQRLKLRIFQERKVSMTGSPDFPLDAVFIAATNTTSLNKVLEEENNHALVDRYLMLEMPWATSPSQVAQVLLHNYSSRLKMQKLPGLDGGSAELGPVEAANMAELYPRLGDKKATGPDYRYKLIIPIGDREIKFSPHAIRLMSYIIAATRFNTDMNKAKEVMPFSKVVNSTIFRDPITRIRFEEGEIADVTNGEVEDLRKLAKLLDEGSTGVASRDGSRWISRVVAMAQRPENHNTVSPDLVFKVFMEMLSKQIKTPDNKTRLKWQDLALRVATQLIVPYIEQDVTLAMAADQASIKSAYYDMFDELSALYRDPRAMTYRSRATNEEKPIDRDRLAAVKNIFQTSQGKALDTAQIAMYHDSMRGGAAGTDHDVMHPGLMSAIASYYAKLTGRLVSVTDLARFAQSNEGDAEVRSQFATVLSNMLRLGYDEYSAMAALRFIGRINGLVAQVQQDRQPQQ